MSANPMPALRALLDDHEDRYGRGDLWRAASEEIETLATPPAPPAAECAAQSALRQVQWCSSDEWQLCPLCDQCEKNGHSPDCHVGAALAAPCECQRLREELAEALFHLHCPTIANLLKVRHSDEAWERKCTTLAAELRQAVDAMRVLINGLNEHRPTLFPVRKANAAAIVAAYDAKHGGA